MIKARTTRARELRAEDTIAEQKLWAVLRNRQLGGYKFRRQQPIDRYFADFACREAKLVIELDGSQHDASVEYDEARTEVLEHAGYRVVRFPNRRVLFGFQGVLDEILAELRLARP